VNFCEAEEHLTSLLKFGIDLGLGRIEKYLAGRKYPWDTIRFIHVGGTNGKGSTAAMIAGILRHAGYRVGLYSSPHIESYCERISIDGKPIDPEYFAELVAEIASSMNMVSTEEQLTEFEFLTVLALDYFRRERVDIAVMEVGMGGRFDATNVIPRTELSVISNISMDHMQYLGHSLEDIAREKAGIVKKGGSLVTAEESPEIRKIFSDKCLELGSEFFYLGDNVEWETKGLDFPKGTMIQKCSIKSSGYVFDDLNLKMPGRHQVVNAATALLSAEVLRGKGFSISPTAVRLGLETTKLSGRFEVLCLNPMIVLDAAHNVAGVQGLKEVIVSVAGNRRLVLVTGVLDDKEQDQIARVWGSMPEWVLVTKPESSRSMAWEQLARFFSRYLDNICVIESIQEAVARGLELAGSDGILCITGSFYILKSARKKLQELTETN